MRNQLVGLAVTTALLLNAPTCFAGPIFEPCGDWSAVSCGLGQVSFFGGGFVGLVVFSPIYGSIWGVEKLVGADESISDTAESVAAIGTGAIVASAVAGPVFLVEGIFYQGPRLLFELFFYDDE